jgi:hypothetical protein
MVKQGYRRSSWSQRYYWLGVPTTRWSRRKASPENLLDHVMFFACHRIARLFGRVEDLGYRTVDQLVNELLRCPTASACSPERSSLLEPPIRYKGSLGGRSCAASPSQGETPFTANLRCALLVCTMKRKELDHISLDRLHPLITGNADAVVAVLDEVRVPDLVQPDRWQV